MQKYNIFTKYHSVLITNQPLKTLDIEDKQIIQCNKENYLEIPFSQLLKETPKKKSVIINVLDMNIDKVFFECTKHYLFVQAAGGLVRNDLNEILFIYRNGKWDLPKGHKEIGETIQETAIREVQEECGLTDLVLKEKLGLTYHVYYMNGRKELKETHWYNMTTKTMELIPQKEEGIEKAQWIGEDKIDEIIANSYLNLQNLLKENKLF